MFTIAKCKFKGKVPHLMGEWKNENENVTWWENNVWREEKHEDGKDKNYISLIGTHSGQDVSLFRQEHPTGMKFQQTSQPRRILHRAFFAWIEQMQCQSLKNIMPRVGRKSIGKFRYAHSSSKAAGSFSIFLNLSHNNSCMLALGQAIWPKFQPSDTIGMGIARIAHPPPRHWKNHQCEDEHTGDEAKEEVIVSLPYTSPLFSERLKVSGSHWILQDVGVLMPSKKRMGSTIPHHFKCNVALCAQLQVSYINENYAQSRRFGNTVPPE